MKIGEARVKSLTIGQTRWIVALTILLAIIIFVSTCSHLTYHELRAIVVGNTIDLASRAEGRVGEILLKENEPYRRGAVLVRLANEGLRAEAEAVEREVEEMRRSLALERSGQGLERRRYELQTSETQADAKLAAALIGIEGIDRILDGLANRRDATAARFAAAEELVAAEAMTIAELDSRRSQALDATRDYEETVSRRRVLASEADAQRRILSFLRRRLEHLDSDRTGVITDLEIELADRQRDLNRLRTLLDELTIVADHDGVVTAILRRPGEYVAAGQPILTVMTTADIWIEAYLPPAAKRTVRPGDRAVISNAGIGGGALVGRVDRILPVMRPFPNGQGGMVGGTNYAVLVIVLDDAGAARSILSPAQQVSARVRRSWRIFSSNESPTAEATNPASTSDTTGADN